MPLVRLHVGQIGGGIISCGDKRDLVEPLAVRALAAKNARELHALIILTLQHVLVLCEDFVISDVVEDDTVEELTAEESHLLWELSEGTDLEF